AVAVSLSVRFDADFVDIFEVRGSRRERRGRRLDPLVEGGVCILGYEGLDGVVRRTTLEFQPVPASLDTASARFDLSLAAQQSESIYMVTCCQAAHRPRQLARAY